MTPKPGGPTHAGAADSLSVSGLLMLAGITLFWGMNWPAMKIILGEVPVWSFRTICLIGGGCGLLLIARLSGLPLSVPRREFGPLLLCALFNVVGWHLFSGYGISLMPAGRASIIAFTMPVWAALLAYPLLGERLTAAKLGGLALGLAGLGVLIGPDMEHLGRAPLGALFMLGAASSWALGTVLVKYFDWSLPTSVMIAWMLLFSALPVAAGAVLLGERFSPAALSTPVWLALAYVLALPMLFCPWAYFKLVRLFPAHLVAIGTLAIPVVGVFSSAFFLGEVVGLRELVALALVCGALALVLLSPALRDSLTSAPKA